MDALDEIKKDGETLLNGGELGTAGAAVETEAERKAREQKAQEDIDAKEAAEWAGFPYVFGSIICEAMPELKPYYTDEKCLEWGTKMVPVARRFGWTAGQTGELLGLVGVSWAMLKPTGAAIIARRRAAAAAAKTPGKDPEKKADNAEQRAAN